MYPVKEDLSPRVIAGVEATPICIVLQYVVILAAFPNIELPFRKVLYVLADLTTAK
jgi:hypothetical protein